MQALIEKAFPPFEVRTTCHDIKAFLAADNGLCVDVVRSKALALARDTDKTLYTIRVSKFKPDQLALTLIFNVLTWQLQSGREHLFPGALSTLGHDMFRLWNVTAKELVKRGYSTEQEYATDLANVRETIRSL